MNPLSTKAAIVAMTFLAAVLGVVYFMLGDHNTPARSEIWKTAEDEDSGTTIGVSEAVKEVAEAVKEEPPENPRNIDDSWAPQYTAGQAAFAKGNYEGAITSFLKAMEKSPQTPVLHLALAASYEKQGQWEQAYKHMKNYALILQGEATQPVN